VLVGWGRLMQQLQNAGSWRDSAVQFVNSVTTLMERLLHYRYDVRMYGRFGVYTRHFDVSVVLQVFNDISVQLSWQLVM